VQEIDENYRTSQTFARRKKARSYKLSFFMANDDILLQG